jgi:hypothetical protein
MTQQYPLACGLVVKAVHDGADGTLIVHLPRGST